MFGFVKKVTCFNCFKKTIKKKASTIKLDTADGKHSIYACSECAVPFNELLSELEKLKNGES